MPREQERSIHQFWDHFYASHDKGVPLQDQLENNDGKDYNGENMVSDSCRSTKDPLEWILMPSTPLLDVLLQHVQQCSSTSRVTDGADGQIKVLNHTSGCQLLEIGCGTSTLSRDLFLKAAAAAQNGHHGDDAPSFDDISKRGQQPLPSNSGLLSILATDVSSICISQNRQRDSSVLNVANRDPGESTDQSQAFFAYETLDVTAPGLLQQPTHLNNYFDIVLDKGCLDTFLFRSKKKNGAMADQTLLTTVLRNIHGMLRTYKASDGTTSCQSRYLILTPRTKLLMLFRTHYAELFDVERHALPCTEFPAGNLEGQGGDVTANPHPPKTNGLRQSSKEQRKKLFLYICYKRSSGEGSISSRDVATTPLPGSLAQETVDRSTEKKTTSCPSCGLTFDDFQVSYKLMGRDSSQVERKWKGHCQHCRSSTRQT